MTTARPRSRRTWRSIAALVALALAAGACDSETVEITTTTTAPFATTTTTLSHDEPLLHPHGGDVVYGIDEEPPTLNPFLPGGMNSRALALIGNAFITGVRTIDPVTLEPVPRVVTELPSVANGGVVLNGDGTMTVRYAIRDDARWADGMPISGYDFMFTWETIMDPHLPIVKTVYEDMIPDAFVVEPKAFEFTLTAAAAALDSVFDMLIPRHDVEGSDFLQNYNRTTWVSGGPFVFEEWHSGSHIRFSRNDAYWATDPETGQELPYLDGLVFALHPGPVELVEAFRRGDVDIVGLAPSVPLLRDLERLADYGVRVEVVGGAAWEHLNFSFSQNSLARNPNSYNAHLDYRRAVAHAIDRQRIVDEIAGGYVDPMTSYLDAFLPSLAQGAWADYAHDPDQARAYLERLCGRQDIDCRARPPTAVFTTTLGESRERIADLLGEMFAEVGIGYRQELEPAFLFLGSTLDSGTWDLGLWSWDGSPALSDLVRFHHVFNPESTLPEGFNFYRYGTPEVAGQILSEVFNQGPGLVRSGTTALVAELIAAMERTVDAREISSHVAQVERLLGADLVIIPLYQSLDAAAVWADRVGGFRHARLISASSHDISGWYRMASDE